MKRIMCMLLMFCFLVGCASGEPGAKEAEIFMINVGKADAILVRVDEDWYLIDTATEEMWMRVQAALNAFDIQSLKGVFVTHTDKDHVGGLMHLAKSDIGVEAWYASAYYLDVKEEKHPAVKAAKERGETVTFLKAGDQVDGVFSVLGPTQLMEDKDDNNSLVMLLKTQSGSAFFAGDMEYEQEALILSGGKSLRADVLKVGNHADNDTTGQALIDAVGAKLALISTSSYEKPETPDPMLMERLEASGAEIYVTELSEAGIRVTMNEQGIYAEYAAYPNIGSVPETIYIVEIDPENERIVIENRSDSPVSLEGFFLYSDRGNELMVFPKGITVSANGKIVVGTRSSENIDFDVLWDEKNVIHDKKTDVITLLDPYARPVASISANE